MSITTYKRWMIESYLYEVDDDKVIGKNDKDEPVTVRQALDSSSDNPTMVKLKKKAQALSDKDKGAEDKPDTAPVCIDIASAGGLGDEPEGEPSDDKPSGEEPEDDGPPFDDPESDDNWWKEGGKDPIDDEKLESWIVVVNNNIEYFKEKGDDEAAAENEESKAQ